MDELKTIKTVYINKPHVFAEFSNVSAISGVNTNNSYRVVNVCIVSVDYMLSNTNSYSQETQDILNNAHTNKIDMLMIVLEIM